MLENFSNKVKKVVGIGAVAAGALTASSSIDNKSEVEKNSDSTTTEYTYTAPDGTIKKYTEPSYTYTAPDFKPELLSQVESDVKSKFAVQLKEAGFDSFHIFEGRYEGEISKDGITFVVRVFKSDTPTFPNLRLIDNRRELSITISSEATTNKYLFEERVSEEVAKDLEMFKK